MEDIIRVKRLIEYIGPRAWVMQTLKRSVRLQKVGENKFLVELEVQEPEILEIKNGKVEFPSYVYEENKDEIENN